MSGCGCVRCGGGVIGTTPGAGRRRRQPEVLAAMLRRVGEPGGLPALRARTPADPSIAVMDAWALVIDILGFHTDRVAEEGYLGTARERRSLVELARLVGYTPRPGVAAGGWLAFEIDANETGPVDLPAGMQVNSIPGPGEKMVTFETGEPLTARAAWNAMAPRRTRPQVWEDVDSDGLWLEGALVGLKPGDPLLVRRRPSQDLPGLERVRAVEVDQVALRTRVVLAGTRAARPRDPPRGDRQALLDALRGRDAARAVTAGRAPGRAPAGAPERAPAEAEATLRLLGLLEPGIAAALPAALRGFRERPAEPVEVWALRVTAPLVGHIAPPRANFAPEDDGAVEFLSPVEWRLGPGSETAPFVVHGSERVMMLEGHHAILPGSWVVVDGVPDLDVRGLVQDPPAGTVLVFPIDPDQEAGVRQVSVAAFGVAGPATEVALPRGAVWQPRGGDATERLLTPYRAVRVHAGSEALALAPMPIADCVEGDEIELDGMVEGLEPGRVVIVAGPLCGIADATGAAIGGVGMAEAARVAEVLQAALPGLGDTPHTVLRLRAPLARRYARAAAVLHGNVAAATHGAVREQVLGGGDPAGPPQDFALRPPPLGHVAAPVAAGAVPTLEVRVDGMRWNRVERMAGQGPRARAWRLAMEADGTARVLFGDGRDGARPGRGEGNIAARWRDGIRQEGNARAGTLALPVTRPLGLKGVTNPLAASGGAGPDPPEAMRRRIPVAARALERLVSAEDYADFALNFAGVAKAEAVLLPSGGRQVLHVTVAGIGDAALDPAGPLVENLREALLRLGDPDLAVQVAPCERLALLVRARLLLGADHRLAEVSVAARQALEARLGFEAVELGQDLYLAAAIAALQAVPGVVAVDVAGFASVSAEALAAMLAGGAAPEGLGAAEDWLEVAPARREAGRIAPAQLCALLPGVAEACVIEEMRP